MLSAYKTISEKWLLGLAKRFYWLNPNILTTIGLVPPLFFVWFLHQGQLALALLMLLLTPLDMLDGVVARANNRVTKFGGFLDSTIDRISDALLFYGLFLAGITSIETTFALIIVSYLISYTRSRAELASYGTQTFNQGLIERPERIIFIGLILIVNLLPISNVWNGNLSDLLVVLLLTFSILTFLQRVVAAYKKLD